MYNDSTIMVPNNVISNDVNEQSLFDFQYHFQTFRKIADAIRIVVSLATLIVNIILFFLIARERKYLDVSDRQR